MVITLESTQDDFAIQDIHVLLWLYVSSIHAPIKSKFLSLVVFRAKSLNRSRIASFDRLVYSGLVVRLHRGTNRSTYYQITPDGMALIASMLHQLVIEQ